MLGEFILFAIIFMVINSFILYVVVKNAVDNSVTLQQIEAKIDVLTKQMNKE